jgi:hypothetical protein
MDHVVQQNASLVEEAAAATESMKDQAAALLELVGRFKLDAASQQGHVSKRTSTSAVLRWQSGHPR